ncbi:MAG: prepilin peptidase [Rhodobacterales bacterium]|nr:MAG: prepilin peptidase [Rhodobacterales bacterium]
MPQISPPGLSLLLLLLGPAMGSFMAALAERLPNGPGIIRTPSHCHSCQRRLRWYELLPILSYLGLRGKCAGCGHPIPARLFYAEIAGLMAAVAAVSLAFTPLHMLLSALLLWCLLGLFLCDIRCFRLPDILTGALLIIGLALAAEDPGRDVLQALLGALSAAAVFYLIRLSYRLLRGREGLGLGDVKLVAGLSAALGITALPLVTLLAALAALGWAVLLSWHRGRPLLQTTPLPFGAYLAAAAAIVWAAQLYPSLQF